MSKIYVGTYQKYNNGSLFGKWLDLEDYVDLDDFFEACQELHKDEDDPELMFQDFEDIPEELISESWIAEDIFDYINFDGDRDALDAFMTLGHYSSLSDYLDAFKDAFMGTLGNDSASENCRLAYWYEELGGLDIPENMQNYFDYEAFGRDLSYDYNVVDDFIFANN